MAFYTYTALGDDNKVSMYEMDPATGVLSFRKDVCFGGGPGPIAVDSKQEYMYVGFRSSREISSYRIDARSGGLTPIGTVSLDADPCFMFVDRTRKYLLSSYYLAGKVTVHAIDRKGAAGRLVTEVSTAEHAHCIQTDRSNRFVLVPHTVPPNAIFQFLFNEKTGALTPNPVPKVSRPAGQGPRHYVYHPAKDFVYVSNENSSSVTAYTFDATSGTLADFQTLSTLPEEGYDEKNTCAQIHMTPDGRMLFVSNRGHDSIACYSVDSGNGLMTPLGRQKTEPVPRVFGVDPTGNFLFAAGQGSGKMEAFRIGAKSPALTPLAVYDVGRKPMWVMTLEF